MSKINLTHILFIVPLFYMISNLKNKTPDYMYNLLIAIAIYIIINIKFPSNKITYYNFIKAMHYFIWIPLLLYVGINKNNSHKIIYPIFKLIALSTGSYHIYYLIKKLIK